MPKRMGKRPGKATTPGKLKQTTKITAPKKPRFTDRFAPGMHMSGGVTTRMFRKKGLKAPKRRPVGGLRKGGTVKRKPGKKFKKGGAAKKHRKG